MIGSSLISKQKTKHPLIPLLSTWYRVRGKMSFAFAITEQDHSVSLWLLGGSGENLIRSAWTMIQNSLNAEDQADLTRKDIDLWAICLQVPPYSGVPSHTLLHDKIFWELQWRTLQSFTWNWCQCLYAMNYNNVRVQ